MLGVRKGELWTEGWLVGGCVSWGTSQPGPCPSPIGVEGSKRDLGCKQNFDCRILLISRAATVKGGTPFNDKQEKSVISYHECTTY